MPKKYVIFDMNSARNSAAAEIRLRPKVSAEIRPKLSALPKFGRTLDRSAKKILSGAKLV